MSRPITLYLDEIIKAYLWDFICVHKEHRISHQLIQTHEYNQRHETPSIAVSIFKRETNLCRGIIPLLEYNAYIFHLQNTKIPKTAYTVIRITKQNIDLLYDFITQLPNKTIFDFIAIPDMGSILELINVNIYYIYCLRYKEHIHGFYFIKDTATNYENAEQTNITGNTITCFASIKNTDLTSIFYMGFIYALREILKIKLYKIIIIEDIAHNATLLELWRYKNPVVSQYKCAYYLFNYIYIKTLTSNKCILL